jgi:hypothetical protein
LFKTVIAPRASGFGRQVSASTPTPDPNGIKKL